MMRFLCVCLLIGTISAHKTIDDEVEKEMQETAQMMDEMEADLESIQPGQDPSGLGGEEEEENIGSGAKFTMPTDNANIGLKEKVIRFFQHEPSWYWKYYKFELGCLAAFFVAWIKFWSGSKDNNTISQAWRAAAVPYLKKEFEHIGCERQNSIALMQKSYNEYDYFASGRKNCTFAEFRLNLVRRHCLLSTLTVDLYYGMKDTVTIDVPMELSGQNHPIEFLIIKKKDLKQKQSTMPHLSDFVKNSNAKHYRPSAHTKNTYMIMAEHDEVANQIVNEQIGEGLMKCGASGMLQELHVTDQRVYNGVPLFMRAVIEISSDEKDKKKIEECQRLVELVIQMVDRVAAVRMSSSVLSTCEKARKKQKQMEAQQKREEVENQKLEQKREQERLERERINRMTPEQLKKYEEKQRKKEQSKMKGRMMKMVKM